MRSIAHNRASAAPELLNLIGEICRKSPDSSCFASTSFLAQSLGRRKADVNAAKWELINSGQVILDYRSNGNRRNLRHRLTLPTPATQPQTRSPKNALSRVPDRANSHENVTSANVQNLVGLALWSEMPRLDLIDCYMRSGWNVCPLVPFGKIPRKGMTRDKWAGFSRDEKIDLFWREPDLNVGLWIEQYTVFDYDSDRQPENTLVAVRGDHSHNYFLAHPEIYNTQKDVAPDIDTRAPGGLIVLPPSIHESGMPYQWEVLRDPEPVPDKLVELWRHRQTIGGPTGFRLDTLPQVIHKGQRDSYVWTYGRSLRAAGASFEQIDLQLRTLNQERIRPRLSERELAYKIQHVWKHHDRPDWTL